MYSVDCGVLPPGEVQEAFDEVTRAQASVAGREQQARQEANRLRNNAMAEKFQIEQATAAYVNQRLQMARTEAEGFEKDLRQYRQVGPDRSSFLAGIWWREMGKLFARMKDNGRIEVLDQLLGGDELDITLFLPQSKKK